MSYDTTIVGGTGSGSGTPDQILFNADCITTGHLNTTLRVYDEAASVYRYARITEVLTSRLVRVSWDGGAPSNGSGSVLWEEQAISPMRGGARSVAIYQQRLVFGGVRDAGNLLLMTKTGQFRNFDTGTARDTDAIAAVGIGGVQSIRHVLDGQQLMLFTDNGISYIPVDASKALTPTTLRSQKVASYGIGNVRPGNFDGGVLMVVAGGQSVRDLYYDGISLRISSDAVSLQATGFLGTVVDAAFLSGANDRPEQLAFFVNSAGRMAVFHSIRGQKIGAWFEWTTYGQWTSVAVAGQVLYAIVQRSLSSYVLERMDFQYPHESTVAFDRTGVPAATPFSVPHLPNGTLAHGYDPATGAWLTSGTVAGGTVTLDVQTGDFPVLPDAVWLGIAYGWWIDLLPPAIELPTGTILQGVQRVFKLHLRLLGANSAKVGADSLVLQSDGLIVDAAPAAANRWWRTTLLGWSRPNGDDAASYQRITRDVPLKVGVMAIAREIKF